MSTKTEIVSVTGSQIPAYVMGRPRTAYVKALSASAAVHEITTKQVVAGGARIAA